MNNTYLDFLANKIKVAEKNGITVSADELHHSTKPHQRDIILWALQMGAALIAADTGMGKTHIAIECMRKQQNHICPMPFDQVDRLIEQYSNKGDLILDPFGGLGTTGVRAVKKGRKAYLCELNDVYAKCAATYLKETEYKEEVPTLFDAITV